MAPPLLEEARSNTQKGNHYDHPDHQHQKRDGAGDGHPLGLEGSHDVPFDIKRIYYIHGAPKGTHRGGHAHKALRQVLWCPYGSIRIRLDNGREKADVLLDSPDKGLIVEHYMWREMIWEKKDSVLCVAADSYYDESDYIRDYDEFLEAVKGKDLD